MTGLAAAAAAEAALTMFKAKGTSQSPEIPLFSFATFNHLIGFEEVWDFERRWARPGGSQFDGAGEGDSPR